MQPNIVTLQLGHDEATGFVVYDTPGYRIDFGTINSTTVFTSIDCKVYGFPMGALQMCLAQQGTDLVAGLSPFSFAHKRSQLLPIVSRQCLRMFE